MQALTAEAIERYLHDLAYAPNYYRLKREFIDSKYTQQEAFLNAANHLRGAYLQWFHYRDAVAALTHLEDARAICSERLYYGHLQMYNTAVPYFEGILSRSGTPEVHRDVHMQNLLLRVTACLP